jgi:hypothetical protein
MRKKEGHYGLEDIITEATKSILEFSGVQLPRRPANADEEADLVESGGYSAVRDSAPAEVSECLGFTCPSKSYTCDQCDIAKKADEIGDERDHISDVAFIGRATPSLVPVFQSRHDAMYDLYSAASTSRGSRALIEFSFFGRMGF